MLRSLGIRVTEVYLRVALLNNMSRASTLRSHQPSTCSCIYPVIHPPFLIVAADRRVRVPCSGWMNPTRTGLIDTILE
jgi:hypothetical protein